MAAVSTDHGELVAELRALAETVLDRLDPILQKAAAGRDAPTGGTCTSCSWCPLCALAALVRGEQHDLVTLVADQAGTLLAALRETLDAHDPAPSERPDAPAPTPASAFVPIDVTIRR